MTNKWKDPEYRAMMCASHLRLYASGYIHPMKGKHQRFKHPRLRAKHISIVMINRWKDPEYRTMMCASRLRLYANGYVNPMKGKHKHFKHPKLHAKRISLALTDRLLSEEHKIKVGLASIEHWKDKNFQEKVVSSWVKAKHPYPDKAEISLNSILQKNFPNKWRYVGSGDFILGRKNPDFRHKTKNLLIEMYEDSWHRGQTGKDRINHFKQFGFDTLIIWEHELKNVDGVVSKIQKFGE